MCRRPNLNGIKNEPASQPSGHWIKVLPCAAAGVPYLSLGLPGYSRILPWPVDSDATMVSGEQPGSAWHPSAGCDRGSLSTTSSCYENLPGSLSNQPLGG